jgi:D-threo-aldose 1-dehydrogenase
MTHSIIAPKAIAARRLGVTGLEISELGFGTAALGNLYRPLDEGQARDTLAAALQAGIRYVDTAPYYGFGLSERRVGDVVRAKPGVVVSTKVGRLLVPARQVTDDSERRGFFSSLPFEPHYDYSYCGVMRSYEDSLQRLGLARVDILFIHDVGAFTHGPRHQETFSQLLNDGGLRALEELRSSGAITAFGVGVNEIAVCLELMERARLDIILLAGRYTLLEQAPLDVLFPTCRKNGVQIVVGGPYNSGILASGTQTQEALHHDYVAAPQPIVDRVRAIESICDRHGVELAAAALQFTLAHPQVVSVIPGLDTPERVAQTIRFYQAQIPEALWEDLRSSGHLRPDAPTPSAARAP